MIKSYAGTFFATNFKHTPNQFNVWLLYYLLTNDASLKKRSEANVKTTSALSILISDSEKNFRPCQRRQQGRNFLHLTEQGQDALRTGVRN